MGRFGRGQRKGVSRKLILFVGAEAIVLGGWILRIFPKVSLYCVHLKFPSATCYRNIDLSAAYPVFSMATNGR